MCVWRLTLEVAFSALAEKQSSGMPNAHHNILRGV